MSDALIAIENLSKSYGDVHALDGLSFEMRGGPVGLLGPNGAGKTTLIKLLLGLIVQDSGRARIAGEYPSTSSGRLRVRRSVGYMPEGDCLIPGMSAVELVSTLARLSGVRTSDTMTRAHEVLDYVGLDESRYRNTESYSTGMKQRLKLAQALVHDPPILLLDEPTNGLDPSGRKHMLDLVHDLGHVQEKTLLLCSHLLPDVERCCREIIVLQKGRVVQQGVIAELTKSEGHRVRITAAGDVERLRSDLASAGIDVAASDTGALLARLESADCDLVFDAARRSGARILAIEPLRSSLEDVFLKTLDAPREVAT